ncbi:MULTISPECIES: hypothetical protein [unclassified Paenibacillus]|uniref:hypothetical protein n=1 Tax=unclassified Paenibacillus TaxID=185978 RepID=UPI000838187F|nr:MULTISPECIES: hypothetical protein [unclassified Paenibacillus]NWL89042.1 hypothetical protein [Paenibacillus sp. 79R4]
MHVNFRKPISLVLKILLCTGFLLPTGFEAQVFIARTLAAPNQTSSIQTVAPVGLTQFAEDTILRLSATKPLAHWKNAETVIEPLGPGTHSWLVTICTDEQSKSAESPSTSNGYLIISATDRGEYKLIEYGTGEDSLFSPSALQSGLDNIGIKLDSNTNRKIVPLYAGPTLAEWGIGIRSKEGFSHFLNALNGEDLPETLQSFAKQAAHYTPPGSAAGSHHNSDLIPAPQTVQTAVQFDPYDNIMWMTSKALDINPQSFERIITAAKRLIFVSSSGDRTYSVPLPVSGYQLWQPSSADADAYSSSEASIYVQSGTTSSPRWIALEAMLDAGKFVAY